MAEIASVARAKQTHERFTDAAIHGGFSICEQVGHKRIPRREKETCLLKNCQNPLSPFAWSGHFNVILCVLEIQTCKHFTRVIMLILNYHISGFFAYFSLLATNYIYFISKLSTLLMCWFTSISVCCCDCVVQSQCRRLFITTVYKWPYSLVSCFQNNWSRHRT